jgi:hypothetical protein
VLVVTTTMGMLHGVHGHTTNLHKAMSETSMLQHVEHNEQQQQHAGPCWVEYFPTKANTHGSSTKLLMVWLLFQPPAPPRK